MQIAEIISFTKVKNIILMLVKKKRHQIIKITYKYVEIISNVQIKAVIFYCMWLCLTFCNPMDSSPPGSSVHETL